MRLSFFQQILIRRHCTRSLSMKLGISESAVSQHLKVLKDANMIYDVKRGYHTLHLPSQEAIDFMAASFDQMRQASIDLDRDPKMCRCEFRQCAPEKTLVACHGDDTSSIPKDLP